MNANPDKRLSDRIKEKAFELGFDLCGIAPARILSEHIPHVKEWCGSGMNGSMNYLCRDDHKRFDPGLLLPGAKSVIVTGLNYYSPRLQGGNGVPVIARYAYGKDYHFVINDKLLNLLAFLQSEQPEITGKICVDSSPVAEKAWAREAGLGWQGKHSLIINENLGSFFFLGELIVDIVLDYDSPVSDEKCGKCTRCIDACPTAAINSNRTIDARRCISYHTIESKELPDETMKDKFGERVFGCDICQEACPWNTGAKHHATPEFEMNDELRLLSASEWLNLDNERFDRLFKGSPLERRKYRRFMDFVTFVTK